MKSKAANQSIGGEPVVSVIMIFFNGQAFIEQAIESVLEQTFPAWELLLIDDGSTDASSEIARKYASLWPDRIRYFEHPGHQNRGMSATRNLGISRARGKYLAFLDSDDVWLPQKLERHVQLLEENDKAGMVYGPTHYWYSWTGKPEDRFRDYLLKNGIPSGTLLEPPALLTRFLARNAAVPGICSLLIRRDVVERVGGFEESFHDLYEDQVFLVKACLETPVLVSSESLDHYRQHPASVCAVGEKDGRIRSAQARYLNWLEGYLKDCEQNDPALWNAYRIERWRHRYPALYRLFRSIRKILERRRQQNGSIPVGKLRFGELRRLKPVSEVFGYDRGTPIDRYYIENFIAGHAEDIHGRVLEVADNTYTKKFGGDRVSQSHILQEIKGNPQATVIADLTNAPQLANDSFDCIILTQTLHYIYDIHAAVQTLYRILRPGGILLATFPGISQVDRRELDYGWYWFFTTRSVRRLFAEAFPAGSLAVESFGNVLAAVSFLEGLSIQDLKADELDYQDPAYEMIITLRAVKPLEAGNG